MQLLNRRHFLDHLRVALVAQVILHHAAITYGGLGTWYLRDADALDSWSTLLLSLLCAVNQAFFMGAFFLIAGYFTPPALERRGLLPFVAHRVARLGLPMLVYALVLGPITLALAASAQGGPFFESWREALMRGRPQLGPMGLLAVLLLMTLAYALWALVAPVLAPSPLLAARPMRAYQKARDRATRSAQQPLPGPRSWALAALGTGAAAWLLRLAVPLGRLEPWELQLGSFASYGLLFVLGCLAWRGRWLERISTGQVRLWGRVALLSLPALPLVALASGLLAGEPLHLEGGLAFPALVYAFWEPLVAWGSMAGLLWWFRARLNRPSAWGRRLSEASFTAFVVHPPLLVGLSLLARPLNQPALLKFALVGSAAVLLSFAAGLALRRLRPRLNRRR